MAPRRRSYGPPGWAVAKEALAVVAKEIGGAVGYVKYVASGTSRDAFVAEVGDDEVLIALVPRDAASASDVEREARILTNVARVLEERTTDPVFRVSTLACAVQVDDRAVLVTQGFRGVPLDMRAGQQGTVRPWQVIGTIAAALHGIEPALVVPGDERVFAPRRAHAQSAVRIFDDVACAVSSVPDPIARARAWVQEHLPPDEPAALLHGDLVGQNVLLVPGDAPCLIDWQHACAGDPAYDLAIVTRGARHPFKTSGGLDLLLDEYRRARGVDVSASEVRLHELCMVTRWYLEAAGEREARDGHVAHVRRLLELATRS